jgi:hypothetical protein
MRRCSASKVSRTSADGVIRSESTTRPPAGTRGPSPRPRGRIADVVQRGEAVHEVEGVGDEGQRFRVALLEHDVAHVRLGQSGRAELEQTHRQVEAHDEPHVGRDHLGGVSGTARDIEREHVGVERLEPLHHAAAGAAHER